MGFIKAQVFTWHLFSFGGFIFDPTGQLKSREKSSMLENGPWYWKTHVSKGKVGAFASYRTCTRNWSGLWTPVSTRSLSAFGRYLAHQTFAADTWIRVSYWGWMPSEAGPSSHLRQMLDSHPEELAWGVVDTRKTGLCTVAWHPGILREKKDQNRKSFEDGKEMMKWLDGNSL